MDSVYGNQTLPFFTSGFGQKLFQPGSQVRNAGRSKNSNFVAAAFLQRSQNCAQNCAGVFVRRNYRSAGVDHFFGAVEKLRNLNALYSRGDHSEIRQRGISTADTRHSVKKYGGSRSFRQLSAFESRG